MTEDRITFRLWEPVQAWKSIGEAWLWAKAQLMAGHRLTLEIKPETRRSAQNALLHALLSDLSKQCQWRGQTLSVDVWKRLCTAAWLREEGESPQMVPALDGKGFDVIFERTSTLSVAQCSRLTEWVMAFAAEQGVEVGER